MLVVNLVVRTAELDQLQGSNETKCRVGSLQLIHQGFSDNQIDHKLVLGFISCYILIISYLVCIHYYKMLKNDVVAMLGILKLN